MVGTEQVVGRFGRSFLVDLVFVVGSLDRVEEQGMGFVVGMEVGELVLGMLDSLGIF